MPQISLSSIDSGLEQQFLSAIFSYFRTENNKLGLELDESQILSICRTLLFGNEPADSMHAELISEHSMLDEYHKDELAIMDYLHLVSIESRKELGQYATPKEIVRYIVKTSGYAPSRDILDKTLIDPSCGSGAFLVEATRIYLNALKRCRMPLNEWYPMARSAIIGIDIDPKACFFARMNLATMLAPAILEFAAKHSVPELHPLPVYCDDTLKLFAAEDGALFYDRRTPLLKNRFDFVVGNPPYFKIKGLGEDLKNVFADSLYGHPNAYGIFIHAGIGMLKKGGRLGFIIPRSMLAGLYFKNLRAFINRETSVREIVYLSDRKKVFGSVLHGTMILSLQRDVATGHDITVSFADSLKDMETKMPAITVKKEYVIRRLNGTTVWFVADSREIYNIIDRIIKRHPILCDPEINCCAKTGQIVWNRVKPLLSEKTGTDILPLIWATDIGKFSFSFNKMKTARPSFLKVTPKTEGLIVRNRSILIQRVTADEQPSRVVACIPEEFCNKAAGGYFVENHLNIIQPETMTASVDLYFILGVLNSEIVDFFFRAMNGNTQVSATELNLLPMPVGPYEKEIADIAEIIQGTPDEKKPVLMDELNRLVARAYGMNNKDIEYVRQYLDKRLRITTKAEKT